MKTLGKITSIKGLIVEVTITGDYPKLKELLTLLSAPEVHLEVVAFSSQGICTCINLTNSPKVHWGAEVVGTGKTIAVPVGEATLGRIFNALGEPVDGLDKVKATVKGIYDHSSAYELSATENVSLLETGLKVIDFFTPFVKGRKIGIIGGSGVGKTVLTMELMHNITKNKDRLSIFVGIGERLREGRELYEKLKQKDLLKKTVLFFGQMNEAPAMRSVVGLSAATSAEHFRDVEKKDILFFIDNIYRHVQAVNELSTTLGEIPSEGGYQPTLFSDLRRFQDRLHSNANGSITSVQAIYIPADDLSDPAVQEIHQQLDSVIVLSRAVAESGIRPAVDLLRTSSSLLTPEIVGERHYSLATKVQAIMQKYHSLKNIVSIVGVNELSPTDREDYSKALKLTQFFSQDLAVTEELSGKAGQFFTREETLDGVEKIIGEPFNQ